MWYVVKYPLKQDCLYLKLTKVDGVIVLAIVANWYFAFWHNAWLTQKIVSELFITNHN